MLCKPCVLFVGGRGCSACYKNARLGSIVAVLSTSIYGGPQWPYGSFFILGVSHASQFKNSEADMDWLVAASRSYVLQT